MSAEYERVKSMMRVQKGLSLVELMIAITLGLILLTGVMQVFLSSKTVFSTQQALSRIQETGRLATEFIARDIRMAGYLGCASRSVGSSVANTLKTPNGFLYNYAEIIRGYSQSTIPAGVLTTPAPIAGTDILVVRGGDGDGVRVTKNNESDKVYASNVSKEVKACSGGTDRISGLCQGDIVIIADCNKARVFQITQIIDSPTEITLEHDGSGTPGNAITTWGGPSATDEKESFRVGAEILLGSTTAYFIAMGTSGRPSLWQNINGTSLELLEGVENMAIKYGVDTSPTKDYIPDSYVAASAVTNWNNVVSVRVELLVTSIEDNIVPEVQLYRFNGVDNIDPEDRRLRQVFVTTVGIRGRLL